MVRTIHCVGDSHVHVFSGTNFLYPIWPAKTVNKIPSFKTYFTGPSLAYNLYKESAKSHDREILFKILEKIDKKDLVLLSFGELDCRMIYLMKHVSHQNESIEKMIDDVLERYFSAITEIKNMGYEVILLGSSPLIVSRFSGREKYPDDADDREINRLKKEFNEKLLEEAKNRNIRVLSILNELLNPNDDTKQQYFLDGAHLSQSAMPMIVKKLQTMLPFSEFLLFRNALLKKFPRKVQAFLFFVISWIKHFWFKSQNKIRWELLRFKKFLKHLFGEKIYRQIKSAFKTNQ